ncbi:SsrA-binding protein SmpB [bacterium]|nr:SsrA-binding protein SmpB [bacterium]
METAENGVILIGENKKAYHYYSIVDTFEAGIALEGAEVKALRQGKFHFSDSYVDHQNQELFLTGFHIEAVPVFGKFNPERKRKLLLHRYEISRIIARSTEKGLTIIPLKIYFKKQHIKLLIALVKGINRYDKRQKIKEKDSRKEIRHEME